MRAGRLGARTLGAGGDGLSFLRPAAAGCSRSELAERSHASALRQDRLLRVALFPDYTGAPLGRKVHMMTHSPIAVMSNMGCGHAGRVNILGGERLLLRTLPARM